MPALKLEDIHGTRYSVIMDTLSKTFTIEDHYNGKMSLRHTGSEGLEVYRKLKKARRQSKSKFDWECTFNFFTLD